MAGSTGAGVAVAALAACCYEVGYAFQALEARAVPERHALRASLVGQLVGNARWLAATGVSLLGWPLQVLALSLAPLALVQPTLALGLLLLLALGSRVLHERVGRRELVAVALVIAGIACLTVAAPERGTAQASTGLLVALAALAAVAVAPYALRGPRRARAGLLAVLSAGAADSVAALAAKLVAQELGDERWAVVVALVVAAGLAGVTATVSEMSALQRLPATRVGPMILALQIAVPVVVAGAVGGEDWGATALGGLVLGAGLLCVVAGAVVLAASRQVSTLTAPPARGSPTPS